MARSISPDRTTQFAGLTRHNHIDMNERAASIAGLDVDDLPETSFSSAVRELETASRGDGFWEVPQTVAINMHVDDFNEQTPDGYEAVMAADEARVFVRTPRYEPVVSPEKMRQWVMGNFSDDSGSFNDALWHFPSNDYSIVNPDVAYRTVENTIQDEELGDSVFGEVREYKGGGEVHMDLLFDAYQIELSDMDREPILLGIRTGYDFFGDQALYFEGFAQDTACSNSIRSVTDREVVRHTGSDIQERIEEAVSEVFGGLGLMADRLAELIEMANDINVDVFDLEFAEVFDHDDHVMALYQLIGFPQYLAQEAANHCRQRADDTFSPSMTAFWDGATYALTHHYQGGENTSRARELIDAANDFVYNPSLVLDQAQQSYQERAAAESDSEAMADKTGFAAIQDFSDSVQEQRQEFESRNEELRESLLAEAE